MVHSIGSLRSFHVFELRPCWEKSFNYEFREILHLFCIFQMKPPEYML